MNSAENHTEKTHNDTKSHKKKKNKRKRSDSIDSTSNPVSLSTSALSPQSLLSSLPPSIGFNVLTIEVKVALAPVDIYNPIPAIESHLNNSLFLYDESLNGIPLSYFDTRIAPGQEFGRIVGDQPWIHCTFHAEVVIFQPNKGLVVKAKIVKVKFIHTY